MKKNSLLIILFLCIKIVAQQQSSTNNASIRNQTENLSNSNNSLVFENNEALQDISKYYFEIKRYIKKQKETLSKEDYQSLMEQNEKHFTLIYKKAEQTGNKFFLEKYKEDLESYKKRILAQVDSLVKK